MTIIIRGLNNTVLNDRSHMYLASICTVGAFAWVHCMPRTILLLLLTHAES